MRQRTNRPTARFTRSKRLSCSVRRSLLSEELRVLLLLRVVDQLHVAVRDPLDLVEALAFIVLGDLVIFEQLLQSIVGVAPDVADRVAPFLRELVDVTGEFPPALFGQSGNRNPDHLAV